MNTEFKSAQLPEPAPRIELPPWYKPRASSTTQLNVSQMPPQAQAMKYGTNLEGIVNAALFNL